MRGAKPKPTNLKILQGNPGKRPLNMREPKPRLSMPDIPEHISAIARDEWLRVSRELFSIGLLTNIDMSALAGYCQAYSRWVEAEEGIKKTGLVVKTKDGNIIQSPLVGIANKALALMHRFLVEFGMTPSSRSRISAQTSKEENPFDKF